MTPPVRLLLIVSAILAAGAVGLVVGRSSGPLLGWLEGILPAAAKQSLAQSEAPGPILYYRDPDGLIR
jgi:Cu(I)/Ag(I) efflux system membrane fusion protein